MGVVLITGSSGLIGSEAARYFAGKGMQIVGIDNDMRAYFFGPGASTAWNKKALKKEVKAYVHKDLDIRDIGRLGKVFTKYKKDIRLVIHTAAQPSHDWAAREPLTDFGINANGTLNLLESTRLHCPEAVFIFTSTNKVYGDLPNSLPLQELETRWELPKGHPFYDGIDESMSIDQSKHSLFGASKAAADILVQEYGRYFGMKTACFRGGCLTGPNHAGAQLHGFLAYLMKCCVTGEKYTVFGYKGKQVRDNIHSYDLITAFDAFFRNPHVAEVYNMGGGRENSCSMLEAIKACEKMTGKKLNWNYSETNRSGDHIWYISHLGKFQSHYPDWRQKHGLQDTLIQIYENNVKRWQAEKNIW
ncbi:MAG: NAD-dependent epimerase/dehydratase family protein [Candidatus Omnitrophica bacterium]|nr:NAD-dependent epimerase/dehydratase family protein [Candidatus Omnitrophota bacterium]